MHTKIARCLKCGRTGKVDNTQTCEGCLAPSKAKDTLGPVIDHLQRALAALAPDFATLDVRSLILAALDKAQHQQHKRGRRAGSAADKFVAAGLTAHDRWWKQIEQSVRDTAKKQAENGEKPAK
jgi:hypothetical protein